MRRLFSVVPAPLRVLGIASIFAAGIAIAGQNQDEPKSTQPKTKTTQKANQDTNTDEAAPDKAAPPARDTDANDTSNKTQQNRRNTASDQATPANDRSRSKAAANGQANANGQTNTEQQRAAVLGAQFDAQGDQGLSVKTIDQNGVLAHSGLRQNDRIISAEGMNFNNARQFEAWLWSQSGRQIPVIIDRGGQRYTVTVNMPQHGQNSGWLGVNLDEGDADTKGQANVKGARVTQVYPSGPASRAGLQQGDVITQINQQPVESAADAVILIRELQPQAQAEFVVMRDQEELKIPVTVGSRANSGYQSFYRGQQPPNFQQGQFNPNDQRFAGNEQFQGNQQYGNDPFNGIPPHAMELEQTRRLAEQNERIENELTQLREEIKQLRELLQKK